MKNYRYIDANGNPVDGIKTNDYDIAVANCPSGCTVEEGFYERRDAVDPWDAIRESRNYRLADCDWTQVSDAPVDKEAWAVYRQALRDVTKQDDPNNIVWPKVPTT